MTHDVAIVGGGPAGLAAAVVLGRALRSVLVIDANEPRNATAAEVHNFLTRESFTPNDFRAAGRADAERYGVEFRTGTVSGITADGPGFQVELADGSTAGARRVLVAIGLSDVLPDVSGLTERWGRSVFHCGHCHGYETRGSAIGVLGQPLGVVWTTLLWCRWSDDMVLFLNDEVELDDTQRQQLDSRNVRVVPGRVQAFTDEGVLLADGTVVPRDNLVVHSRVEVRADFLAPLGLKPVDLPMGLGTYLPVEDPTGRTSVPGLWVAGNASDARAQLMSAAASGVTAGEALAMNLVMADLG
ncbi:NAD(P)/FAD-dependent oxidoreductase [Streptomyces sp. ID05-26A]|jgi:thioredoxin reductase|uniref:Thioredoxin reductase n=1 Tax=uncultured bacterium esnapd7 TaxID=1366614 RepID=S5TKR3_9BACT|nr:thioredoxin reductase [uncultured bacterium esnapd7]MDX3659622.1 NAD(P)/FAD-dependent oxidoreductase [Streptomyces sp. ID05-26A]